MWQLPRGCGCERTPLRGVGPCFKYQWQQPILDTQVLGSSLPSCISHSYGGPAQRLDTWQRSSPSTTHEGKDFHRFLSGISHSSRWADTAPWSCKIEVALDILPQGAIILWLRWDWLSTMTLCFSSYITVALKYFYLAFAQRTGHAKRKTYGIQTLPSPH